MDHDGIPDGQGSTPGNPWCDGTFFPNHDEGRAHKYEDAAATALCLMCDKEGIQKCSRCQARYCSKECQEKDWTFHKLICNSLATKYSDPSQPPQHFRALLLSQNKSKPQLVWVRNDRPETTTYPWAEIDRLLSRDSKGPAVGLVMNGDMSESIPINPSIPKRRCGRGLHMNVLCRTRPNERDGQFLKLNESIARLSPPGHAMVQYGPVLVWAYDHKKGSIAMDGSFANMHISPPIQPKDFTARDFRSFIDFLHSYMANPCVIDPERFLLYRDCTMVPAVKVNCDGDVKRYQPFLRHGISELPRFESVMVPSQMPVVLQEPASWAELLGLAWDVRLVPSNIELGLEERQNPHAKYLGPLRQVSMGTVLVMRTDGGPIHRLHVNWMISYVGDLVNEHGLRLLELCSMMGKGQKVKEDWGDLKLNWLTFLKKKYKQSDGTVALPWKRT
ncbi:putative Suppressor of anucleate metulae protein B [Seiridium cardinale]